MIDALPPPIVRVVPAAPIVRALPPMGAIVEMLPGIVRCSGEFVEPLRLEAPFVSSSSLPRQQPVSLVFDIDESGRAVSIAPERSQPPFMTFGGLGDLQPSLAGSRFPATAKVNCRLTYAPRVTPAAETDPKLLAQFVALPWNRSGARPNLQGLVPQGATCPSSRAQPRTIVYPRLETLKFPPGSRHYAAIRYDVSNEGVPRNIRVMAGSGHPGLEAEALRALGASRFAPEPRTGCLAFIGGPSRQPLEAPALPRPQAGQAKEGVCKGMLEEIPKVEFPPEFSRRSIEGWALVRYSIAPWGQIGSVEVVDAQPAAAFGESARRLILQAKARPSEAGRSGCLQRIRFRMSDSRAAPGVRLENGD